MKKVILYTRDGEEVTQVDVPDFSPPAEVLLWGERYFVWNNAEQKYLEGMCYFIPEIQ